MSALSLLLNFGKRILGDGSHGCRRWLLERSSEEMIREEAGVVYLSVLSRRALFIENRFGSLFRRLFLQLAVPFLIKFLSLQFCLCELFRNVVLPSNDLFFGGGEGYLFRNI